MLFKYNYILITYWAIQVGNKTIRSYNRLELQGMYPFVAIVDSSLIFEWVANRADSAINKTPAVIQRRTLLMDCICICSQRSTEEEELVKMSKVVAMFIVNPVENNIGHDANFWDRSAKSGYHVIVTRMICKSFKQNTQAFLQTMEKRASAKTGK